jgi:hypothetical protein
VLDSAADLRGRTRWAKIFEQGRGKVENRFEEFPFQQTDDQPGVRISLLPPGGHAAPQQMVTKPRYMAQRRSAIPK